MEFMKEVFISSDMHQLGPYGAMAGHWTSNPGVVSLGITKGNGTCRKVQVDNITV